MCNAVWLCAPVVWNPTHLIKSLRRTTRGCWAVSAGRDTGCMDLVTRVWSLWKERTDCRVVLWRPSVHWYSDTQSSCLCRPEHILTASAATKEPTSWQTLLFIVQMHEGDVALFFGEVSAFAYTYKSCTLFFVTKFAKCVLDELELFWKVFQPFCLCANGIYIKMSYIV